MGCWVRRKLCGRRRERQAATEDLRSVCRSLVLIQRMEINHWEVSNRNAIYEGLKLESSVCCSKDATVLEDVKGESNLCNSLCL